MPQPISDSDFHKFDIDKAKIGQLLFYDKILSGNKNISCGTCHNHDFGGSDGLSLGIGEGGIGIGPERVSTSGPNKIMKRVPRNASALWNLGSKQFSILFHDGRLSNHNTFGNNFNTPAEEWLPYGLGSPLSAQAIFPMVAQFEMAGNSGENEIAGAIHDRIDMAWPIIAKRVRTIEDYGDLFVDAFDEISSSEQVEISHIGEALAAFIGIEWKSIDSRFDDYLAGENAAIDAIEKRGMDLFYGKANCSSCHSGALFTDHDFYALAIPPFGPGRTRTFDPYARDVGRMAETDRIEDAYRFRTPSLKNIALTAPYGHNGAYPNLYGIIKHHLAPQKSFDDWEPTLANLPKVDWLTKVDFLVQDNSFEMARVRNKIDIAPVELKEAEIYELIAFLGSLTGETVEKFTFGIPTEVPSGLSIDSK